MRFNTRPDLFASVVVAAVMLFVGCGEDAGPGAPDKPDSPGPTPVDTIPPATIDDLVVTLPGLAALTIGWTATGDDGDQGTASRYDIRYATEAITEHNWDTAVQLDNEPAPREAGLKQALRVNGLQGSTVYYFVIKALDEAGNASGLSNCPNEETLPENVPPAAVTDLNATAIDGNTMMLTWTTPGDDGDAGQARQYDIRFAEGAFGAIDWATAAAVDDIPSPKAPGEPDTVTVTGLNADTDYRFALKTADEVPNWSPSSNVAGELAHGNLLEVSSRFIDVGDTVDILFRAEAGKWTKIMIRYSAACNDYYRALIADRYFSNGTHLIRYDFDGVAPSAYQLVVCSANVVVAFKTVVLNE